MLLLDSHSEETYNRNHLRHRAMNDCLLTLACISVH